MVRFIIFAVICPVLLCQCANDGSTKTFPMQKEQMVDQQIRSRGVKDARVLEALLKVDRHLFVPEDQRKWAYQDHPLPIGYGQTISQPYIVGLMTELLQLDPQDKVLEIGTGSGYQAAVLGELVKDVYTIEIVPELAQASAKTLKSLGYSNVHVRQGDGYQGWPQEMPFDAVIVTAAPPEVPQELIDQLRVGGKMVVPVGALSQDLYLLTKTVEGIVEKNVLPVRFVPMVREP